MHLGKSKKNEEKKKKRVNLSIKKSFTVRGIPMAIIHVVEWVTFLGMQMFFGKLQRFKLII